MKRLYVIVRADLPAGAQLAQSCHAVAAFSVEHPEIAATWVNGEANIVCLTIPTWQELGTLLARAEAAGVPLACFCEPDYDDELTAVALHEDARALVSCLPLALRERKSAA